MKDIAFLRTSDYDSSQTRMRITPDWITWAWGVRNKDIEDFLEIYSDMEWVRVDVDGKYVYAVDYPTADRVICSGVCNLDDDIQLVDFRAAKHCIKIQKVEYWDEYSDMPMERFDVKNPFAAIISPVRLDPRTLYRFYGEERRCPGSVNTKWVREAVILGKEYW